MILLTRGPMRLAVSPERGGSVQSLSWRNRDLLRSGPEEHHADWDARNMAAFPLIPFIGRIQEGCFSHAGQVVRLPANMPPEPHAIHGFGWQRPWAIDRQTSHSLSLAQSSTGTAWPWRYLARQVFSVFDNQIEVELSLTNQSTEPMPAGLGWHPYFNRKHARIETPATAIWEAAGDGRGLEPRNIGESLALTPERSVESLRVDHAFDLAQPRVRLTWPDLILDMSADRTLSKLVVYIPDNEDFFCAEPVSHAPDAVNSPLDDEVTGLQWLAPGESLQGSIRLTATPMVG